MKLGTQLGLCALVLTCAACSQQDAEPPTIPQMQDRDMGASSIGESLTQQVSGAVADLATRTGIAANAIVVSEARVVQWGSGAIGCPRDGMNYTQAIVPGVLLILQADGVFYRYHGRSDSKLSYCPPDRAQEPAYGPGKEFM